MSKKSSLIARRAWHILDLALLWARKGGLFRNRVAISLNIFHKVIRKLIHSNESRRPLVYGDHEFSIDDTPIIHVKMHRPLKSRFKMPHIPCINPHVDFDYDEEDIISSEDEEDIISREDELWRDECDHVQRTCFLKEEEEEEEEEDWDEEIDLKAEKFIAKFYEQIKLQGEIPYIQYNESMTCSEVAPVN